MDFAEYLKSVENPDLKGFDKKRGAFFPHASQEGGAQTIGYGHKLQKGEDFSAGLTPEQADELLKKDIANAAFYARNLVDRHYGAATYQKLAPRQQEMLVDFAYNLGPRFIKEFPKFTKAVVQGDMRTAFAESTRYGELNGEMVPLARNEQFLARFAPQEETK